MKKNLNCNRIFNFSLCIAFVSLLGCNQTGIRRENEDDKSLANEANNLIYSPMQLDFNWKAEALSFEKLQDYLSTVSPKLGYGKQSDLYGLTLGLPLHGSINSEEFRNISESEIISKKDESCTSCFDHSIQLFGQDTLRGILISLYARPDIISKYECPEWKYPKTPKRDYAARQLDTIFSCAEYKMKFAEDNHSTFINRINDYQKTAIEHFLFNSWLGTTFNYYKNLPDLIIKNEAGNGFNPYSGNISLVWIRNDIITIVRFCTEGYGMYHASEEDYFQEVEKYQKGEKRYPILQCLITTVNEAKKANYLNIYRFLYYDSPVVNGIE